MNEEIGFVSEPHVGSTFTFTAVFSNESTNLNEFRNSNSQSGSVLSEFQGMKALVVDSRPVRLKVTKYHLLRLGIHVAVFFDFNHTLSFVSSGTYLINMVLIEMEVWVKVSHMLSILINKLSKDDVLNVPKLFLLANHISPTKVYAIKADGHVPPVIMKPLRASMLAATLERAMGVENKGIIRNGRVPYLSLHNPLGGKRILVVDDNVVNLKVAEGALKKYGARVARAESGKKAISMVRPPHDFDACFMYIKMPEMDGFEPTKRIRDMEHKLNDRIQCGEASKESYRSVSNWHVPILSMTADVIQTTQEVCLKCGMDGYVSKPFEGEQLYREVARFFKLPATKSE